MRELIVTENITIDGVIDAAEGWFAPGGDDDTDQSDVLDALRQQREAADALLLGRVTFEQLRGYWPLQTDDTTGITDYLDNVAKYVVSTTLKEPDWARTTVLEGPLVEEVQALKSSPWRRHRDNREHDADERPHCSGPSGRVPALRLSRGDWPRSPAVHRCDRRPGAASRAPARHEGR